MATETKVALAYAAFRQRFPTLPSTLTTSQLKSVTACCNGRDLLCVTPTGSGKSLTMFVSPWLKAALESQPNRRTATIIISPLESLMSSMIAKYKAHGFNIVRFAQSLVENKDNYSTFKSWYEEQSGPVFIITSAESLFWKNSVKQLSSVLQLEFIFVDECHVAVQWGDDQRRGRVFRKSYGQISSLRCFWDSAVVMGLFTATLDAQMARRLKEIVGFDSHNGTEVVEAPIRKDVYLELHPCKRNVEVLDFVVAKIRAKGVLTKKTIIFVNGKNDCRDIYYYLDIELGGKGISAATGQRLFAVVNGETSGPTKEALVESFSDTASEIRIVIATIALGMGVDIPDVRRCILYGLPLNVLDFVQKIGRCGRDKEPAKAKIFPFKTAMHKSVGSNFALTDSVCLNLTILQASYKCEQDTIKHAPHSPVCQRPKCNCSMCNCCSSCRAVCPCRKDLASKK